MSATFLSHRNIIFSAIAVFLAMALQIQVTLFTSADYLGLRVNLADFVLPFLGLFILFSLLRKSSHWPAWDKPFGYWTIALLSVIIIASAINGYFITGQWSNWAWINKGLGWFILMAYMAAGGWLATNARDETIRLFVIVFLSCFCAIAAAETFLIFLFLEFDIDLLNAYRGQWVHMSGLMYNRNAFAFLLLCAALLASELLRSPQSKATSMLIKAFWFLMPFCILLNGSRALWVLIIPLALFLGFRHKTSLVKNALIPLAFGIALLPFVFQSASERLLQPILNTVLIVTPAESIDTKAGGHVHEGYDLPRLTVLQDSFDLFRQHPITGAGLGSLLHYQEQQHGKLISTLDTTFLWILTEMGPFGLFGFVLVYIMMVHRLYKREPSEAAHTLLSKAALFMLIAFGMFSLFHEILYSRFLWFILGMALAVPIAQKDQQDHANR